MKKYFKSFPPGSAEYVVLHGFYQQKRKRGLSLSFVGIKNPRKAFDFALRFAYFPINGIYLKEADLSQYHCAACGLSGHKLWRSYQTIPVNLLCADCAAIDQKKNISDIDETGRYTGELGKTDQIGWYVPAIPKEDIDDGKIYAYWGYGSMPAPAIIWWLLLPTKKEEFEPTRA